MDDGRTWGAAFSRGAGLAMDLADVRILLEPGIAELAALHATEEDIQRLFCICNAVEEKIRIAGSIFRNKNTIFDVLTS